MSPKQRASRNPPGVLCFSLDPHYASIHKRKSYETKRRREVAEVREVGACLRCRLMKMPVCLQYRYILGVCADSLSVLVGDLVSDVLRHSFLLKRRLICGCCLVFLLFWLG
jgi:hypothetical protein